MGRWNPDDDPKRWAERVAYLQARVMREHRATDPGCRYHRSPRGWLSLRRYDRARGKSCDLCMSVRGAALEPSEQESSHA